MAIVCKYDSLECGYHHADYTIDCHGLFISLHTGVYRYRLGIHHFAHVDLFDVRPQSK